MATVQIANIYNPLTFARRTQEAQTRLNRFLASGVAVKDAFLASQIAQGGTLGELTNYNPLTVDEPEYVTDRPADTSTPANIAVAVQKFRVAYRHKSWSTMDLARQIALEDPVGAITNRIGHYWAADDEKRIIATTMGILADNIANDASDMVIDVATDGAGAVGDAERISATVLIDAMQTLGDHKDTVSILAVHSAVHARLQKQQLISYIRDADNNVMFETYMGKRLIIDDSLPAVAGTNRVTYTCVLYAPGVIIGADARVMVPSEIDRAPAAGNGGGQDVIHSRIANVWHPVGFTFTDTTKTGGPNNSQTSYADLMLAANWDRVFQRKNIPMAFIKVND